MRVTQPSVDLLIVEKTDHGFARFCIGGFVVLLLIGVVQLFKQPLGWQSEQVLGSLAGCGVFALIYIVMFEQVRFSFHRKRRVVTWQRRRALRNQRGELSFADILQVRVEVPPGDEGHPPNRRILLETTDGVLPLTLTTSTDRDDQQLHLAEQIRQFMGADAREPGQAAVEEAIVAGQTVQAVKLLREQEFMSLTEAKQRVEEIRARILSADDTGSST